jgi:hypothetical protein
MACSSTTSGASPSIFETMELAVPVMIRRMRLLMVSFMTVWR